MLVESGCEQLNIGAESGSPRILKMINKGITPKNILAVNQKIKPFAIYPWFYFVVGFPGEAESDINKTIKLVIQLLRQNPRAKVSGIGCYTPYPGTPMYQDSQKLGFKPPRRLFDWRTYAVDQINIPWIKGKLKRKIEAIQFASFFLDEKARDVVASPIIKLAAWVYRPFAWFRLKHNCYQIPVDVWLGNKIKKKLARDRNWLK